MSSKPTSCAADSPHRHDDEAAVPAESLVAGTLALMSAHAHCSCGNRRQIEGRIVDHLHALSSHPLLGETLRATAWHLAGQWAHAANRGARPDSLLAAAPATVQ